MQDKRTKTKHTRTCTQQPTAVWFQAEQTSINPYDGAVCESGKIRGGGNCATAPNPSRETLFAFNQPCFCFSQHQHACRRVPTADCRLQTIGHTAHPTLSHTTRILLQISTGIKANLPRVARGVLVDREVADVHKLVSKARFQRLLKLGRRVNPAVGVLSQRVGPAGRQDVGCPVQPRGHVGAKEGVHPKMELPPVPKQRSCYVALTRWGNG